MPCIATLVAGNGAERSVWHSAQGVGAAKEPCDAENDSSIRQGAGFESQIRTRGIIPRPLGGAARGSVGAPRERLRRAGRDATEVMEGRAAQRGIESPGATAPLTVDAPDGREDAV